MRGIYEILIFQELVRKKKIASFLNIQLLCNITFSINKFGFNSPWSKYPNVKFTMLVTYCFKIFGEKVQMRIPKIFLNVTSHLIALLIVKRLLIRRLLFSKKKFTVFFLFVQADFSSELNFCSKIEF